MTMEELDRTRIFAEVTKWFCKRPVAGSHSKRMEVAALIAETRALALEELASVQGTYQNRIKRFRKIAESFREEARALRKRERTL